MLCFPDVSALDRPISPFEITHIRAVSLRHAGAKGVRIYSSYSFLVSALGAVSGQGHALAVLYPLGKDPRYPLDRRLGGPQ
jgi:hypothetical protein